MRSLDIFGWASVRKAIRTRKRRVTIAYETALRVIGQPKEKTQFLLSAATVFGYLCEFWAVGSGYVGVTTIYFVEKSTFHKISPLNASPLKFGV